jgi:hypothetical protein
MDISDYGPLLTADAFFEIDFGERIKAELEDGEIRPLVRGPLRRVEIAGNVQAFVGNALRRSGFRPYGSGFALRSAARSVRYPDLAVYASSTDAAETGQRLWLDDPLVALHVLPTARFDRNRLIDEYRRLPSMTSIVLIDFETELSRVVQRTGAMQWTDTTSAGGDIALPLLDLTIPHAEIFATD